MTETNRYVTAYREGKIPFVVSQALWMEGETKFADIIGEIDPAKLAAGTSMGAEEALHFGLVNKVVPVEEYLDAALKLAEEIAARAPLAVQLGKEAVNQAYESHLREGLADERRLFYMLFATEDQKEGMAAFQEKRDPEWKGK